MEFESKDFFVRPLRWLTANKRIRMIWARGLNPPAYHPRKTMSTLAYAAMTRARTAARPGSSTQAGGSPGLRTYVDALAALVPAEILAAHATILTFTTKTADETVTITERPALVIAFYGLIGISILLYVGARRMASKWDKWDWLRMLIPGLAFVGWTMLQKATAFDAVADDLFSEATRNVIAILGGIILGLAAAALAYKADEKPVS
jgi:hypothetical protein